MGLFKPNVGRLEEKGDIKGLINALKQSEVGSDAAGALARIGKPAIERLIQALKDKNSRVRQYAAESLGEIGDARAFESLIQALKDEDVLVRRNAAKSLGEIGDARAVEFLIRALKDEEDCVRINAVDSLGVIGDARAATAVLQALKDSGSQVRKSAAAVLIKIVDAQAVEPLIKALQRYDIGDYAAQALRRIGKPAVEPLIKAWKSGDSLVRAYAAEIVLDIGDERAVEQLQDEDSEREAKRLIEALKDDNPWSPVRREAIRGLASIGSPAVGPLLEALKDGSPEWVNPLDVVPEGAEPPTPRSLVATALGEIGSKRAIEPLTNALTDMNRAVREAAKRALEKIKAKQS